MQKKKKKDYLKWTFKPSYMSHKAKNYLVETRKNKVTLTFKKHAYIGMCIFELSDSLMYQIKTEDAYEDFTKIKKCLTSVFIQLSQNIIIIQTN